MHLEQVKSLKSLSANCLMEDIVIEAVSHTRRCMIVERGRAHSRRGTEWGFDGVEAEGMARPGLRHQIVGQWPNGPGSATEKEKTALAKVEAINSGRQR